eukprot:364999-Chlamydomonas_euryale.AAC.12
MTTPALAVEAKAYGMASVSLDQPVLAGKAMETLVAIATCVIPRSRAQQNRANGSCRSPYSHFTQTPYKRHEACVVLRLLHPQPFRAFKTAGAGASSARPPWPRTHARPRAVLQSPPTPCRAAMADGPLRDVSNSAALPPRGAKRPRAPESFDADPTSRAFIDTVSAAQHAPRTRRTSGGSWQEARAASCLVRLKGAAKSYTGRGGGGMTIDKHALQRL